MTDVKALPCPKLRFWVVTMTTTCAWYVLQINTCTWIFILMTHTPPEVHLPHRYNTQTGKKSPTHMPSQSGWVFQLVSKMQGNRKQWTNPTRNRENYTLICWSLVLLLVKSFELRLTYRFILCNGQRSTFIITSSHNSEFDYSCRSTRTR